MSDSVFVGIDISQARLDVHLLPQGRPMKVSHDEKGIETLVNTLVALEQPIACTVLEATGGLETKLALALARAGVPFAVVNPRQARDYARALGCLAKTDAIDAAVLARFARDVRPALSTPPDQAQRDLAALVRRRAQIVKTITQERNRLRRADQRDVRQDIEEHLADLERRRQAVEKKIQARVDSQPSRRAVCDLLTSVPGVGTTTAHALVALLPELGHIDRRQIAALVGVAPINRDSGARRGHRMVWGGRSSVRSSLHMATMVATRFNPPLRSMWERLRAQGKPAKVARTACMRKLLVTLNAIARDNTPWREMKCDT